MPNDLTSLTKVFDKIKSFRSSSYFDWTRWDTISDGEAHFVDTDTKPNRLYWVRALQILGKLSDDGISSIKLPPSEFARMLLSQTGEQGLPGIIAPLLASDSGQGILSQEALARVDSFREILRKAMKDADRKEEDDLIAATLDTSKLEAFYKAVGDTRKQYARMRPLLDAVGSMIADSNKKPGKEVPSWGFNQLDDKGAFYKKLAR